MYDGFDSGRVVWRSLTCYIAAVLLIAGAAFFDGLRLWGLNWWLHYPVATKAILVAVVFATGLLVIPLSRILTKHTTSPEGTSQRRWPWVLAYLLTTLVFSAAFLLGHTQTHFLGDGYELLFRLSNQVDPVKQWDVGASLTQLALYRLIGGNSVADALLTYRITAIVTGLLVLTVVFLCTRRLFENKLSRLLFCLGVLSGGYMLLFFGYVENYSVLIACSVIFTIVGVLAAQKRVTHWLLAPLVVIAAFFHIFGLLLLPGFLYLLVRGTQLGRRVKRLSWLMKSLLLGGLVVATVFGYVMLRQTDYFFTFALLPITPDQFTAKGDWLFSAKHLMDVLNILVMLVPGTIVFLFIANRREFGKFLRSQAGFFLLIQCVVTLLAVFIINPGIGMPRNWDLFSIVGVPLCILCFFFLMNREILQRGHILATLLMITLNLTLLGSRVYVFATPDLGCAHFRDYLEMDKARSRNAWNLLVEYYTEMDDSAIVIDLYNARDRNHPEVKLNDSSLTLINSGNSLQAIPLLKRAIKSNPVYWDAYSNLGLCLLNLSRPDTAVVLLGIANGLNPNNAQILDNLGSAYYHCGKIDKADRAFQRALEIDSTQYNALVGLAVVFLAKGDLYRSLSFLEKHFQRADREWNTYRYVGDSYLTSGYFDAARQAYQMALSRGMDSSYYNDLRSRYPMLQK